MTNHTGRAGLEREELYAVAHEFDELRTESAFPGHRAGFPTSQPHPSSWPPWRD